jgi:hypothetical protein
MIGWSSHLVYVEQLDTGKPGMAGKDVATFQQPAMLVFQ